MRKDYLIALLVGISAMPLGLALMAAPELLKLNYTWFLICFWGGLALTFILMGTAVALALRSEASRPRIGHKRRMIPMAWVIVLGLAFVGSAAWHLWPDGKTGTGGAVTIPLPGKYHGD